MSNIPGRAAVYPQPIPVVTRNAARDKPEPYVWRRLSSGFLDTLLVRDDDTVEFVRRFKGRLTPIARKIDPGRSLWQKSFYDHALRRSESVFSVAGYIWENPVRSGLTDSPEKYTLSGSFVWPDWRLAYNI